MKTNLWWCGPIALGLMACSSSAPENERCTDAACTQTTVAQPPPTTSALPNAGAGGPSQGLTTQMQGGTGVGIITNPVMDDPLAMFGMAPTECETGMFCAGRTVDSDVCGTITFESEVEVTRHPGNIVIVFDRSQSMGMMWNGQQRWKAAGDAITAALEPLTADIAQAAAIFFPTPVGESMTLCVDPTGITCLFVPLMIEVAPMTCEVGMALDQDHIAFADGPSFLATIKAGQQSQMGQPYYFPVPAGFTPLMEGLQRAQTAMSNATLEGQTAVVVITDGEPNCMWNAATANQIVTDWYNQGISTHVIGLPGIGGIGPQVLNDLAAAGGTGQYLTPGDPAQLQTALKMIVSETVKSGFNSCDIALNPAVEEREKLLMIANEPGVGRQNVPKDFGWVLNAEGTQVTLSGPLCEDAKRGRFSEITFEYGCPDVPIPPPLPPIE